MLNISPVQGHHDLQASSSVGPAEGRSAKRKFDDISNFETKFSQRVAGKSITDLYAVEVYSGTAGLTAALRRVGLVHSLGVDAYITKQVKAPVVRLDLTTSSGVELLWKILQHPRVAFVHLGPPCGTSSRARDIRRKKRPDPKPLRSAQFPDGLPTLQGVSAKRVQAANQLYSLAGQFFLGAHRMAFYVHWKTQFAPICGKRRIFLNTLDRYMTCAKFAFTTACMERLGRSTQNFCAIIQPFTPWPRQCDGAHPHLPWGHTGAQWATSLEVEYPHALCHTIAQVCHRLLLEVGVVDVPTQMQQDNNLALTSSSRAVTGSQPRGKKLHPLMRQYSCIIKIRGPKQALEALPEKCSTTVPISLECKVTPPLPMLPPHSKHLKPLLLIGDEEGLEKWEAEYGIAWTPADFVREAAGRSHPGHFMDGVHPVLANLFTSGKGSSLWSHACDCAPSRCASGYSEHSNSVPMETQAKRNRRRKRYAYGQKSGPV